jgi:hypothetical protein
MTFQVLGPFVREGLPERPLCLIVVKGMPRRFQLCSKAKVECFYLVISPNLVQGDIMSISIRLKYVRFVSLQIGNIAFVIQ